MSLGAIYIVAGDLYVKEALYSAKTLKKYNDIPITFFSDRPIDSEYVDTIKIFERSHKRPKVDFMPETPYEKTLYLDSDTQIMSNILDIFSIIDRFDLAAVHDYGRKNQNTSRYVPEYNDISYAFPEFNSGVVLYNNNEKVRNMFCIWSRYYYKYFKETNNRDQPSFRIALWESEVSIHSLPFEYNVRSQLIGNKMRKQSTSKGPLAPRVQHWHGVGQTNWFQNLKPRYRPMRF